MIAIIAFIIILVLLVFVHEAGHFIAARRAGMGVEEFGFGFPPRMFGFQRHGRRWRIVRRSTEGKRGEPTIYSINWIPLGGFVRITGESGTDADDPTSFAAKPRWQRAIVLLAGVGMNFVLAIVLFTATFAAGTVQVIDGDLPTDATVRDRNVRVFRVLPESPAARAGVESGDTIVSMDGQATTTVRAVQDRIHATALTMTVTRDGVPHELHVQPDLLPDTQRPVIGVHLAEVGTVSYPFPGAVVQGVRMVGFVAREIFANLGGVVRGLFSAHRVPVDIAGPIGIAVMTGQIAQLGIAPLIQFAGVLSVNLALLNVFPFPALDGGRLFLLLLEAIRRRALAKRVEQMVHATGYVILLLLVVAVTYHDIVVFGGSILAAIRASIGL